jgi:hypothetical protein
VGARTGHVSLLNIDSLFAEQQKEIAAGMAIDNRQYADFRV